MKRKKAVTKVALAYVYGTGFCKLYKPGDGTLRLFQQKHGFAMTVGSFDPNYPDKFEDVGRFWMIHFHHAVVRDKVDPLALHKTLMAIPEFRRFCAYDIPLMDRYEDACP